jgi:hypothetical protein
MLTEDFSNLIKKRQYPEICRDERELIELFKTVKHSKNDVNKMLADAWLGIYVNDDTLFNPLNNLPPQAAENFTQYLVWLMSQPDYFYFIIKCMFNMDSFPFQCLLLRELFNHKYPLLIGARGLSKTSTLALYLLISMIIRPNIKIVITGAGFRQAKLVFEEMEKVWQRSPVLRSCFPGRDPITHGTDSWKFRLGGSITHALPTGPDGSKVRGYRANILLCVAGDTLVQTDRGLVEISNYLNHECYKVLNINNELEMPDKIFKTHKQDVYEILTTNGYSIKCSGFHQLWVTDGKKSYWKLAKNLNTKEYLELDTNNYFPEKYIEKDGLVIDEDMGYLIGLLVSEGDVASRNKISISQTDYKLIEEIKQRLPLNWKEYYKEAYQDTRGWDCKESWTIKLNDTELRTKLYNLGLDYVTVLDKSIPWCILQSPKSVVIEFLKGLFIGDGSCFQYIDNKNDKIRGAISYYSSSECLINQLHILMLKFGVIACKIKRKSKISKNPNWVLKISNNTVFVLHDLIKNQYWDNTIDNLFKFSRSNRVKKKGNSFVSETTRCDKTVYIGSYQSEEECQKGFNDYWSSKRPCMRVKSVVKLKEQQVLYDFVMPESHSFCGGGFINHNCDEFASTNRTVFEEVMGGFLSVAANPIEQIHKAAKSDLIKTLPSNLTSHILQDEENDPYALSNQLILAGTAYYKHNHFYTYYNKWRQIISSAGDKKQLEEMLGGDYDPNTFNWKDYSVIRIPIKLSTKGFMDMSQVSRTKASTSKDVYAREFDCIFTDDSDGFYRRSIIDSCTVSEKNIIKKNDEEIKFGAVLYGDPNKKYIYGVDPAYEGDNFAIVILECEPDYRKVVHVWTTQASDHKQLLADKIITENDYYHYAARKIRNLMKRFPCAYIAIDTQGGGRAVIEALSDNSKLESGERMILPYIDPTQAPKDTDCLEGDHIIFEVKPTSDWNIEANHSLKKDMEMKDIIFPAHDGISYTMAEFYDNNMGAYSGLYDTLEDCIFEIEELKNELTMIVVTETATGKQRFDTPEIKIGITKKGKLKKDRYSALLMANYVARNMDVLIPRRISGGMFGEGGFAKPSVFIAGNNSIGNPNIINQFEQLYDAQLSARPKH